MRFRVTYEESHGSRDGENKTNSEENSQKKNKRANSAKRAQSYCQFVQGRIDGLEFYEILKKN